MPKFDTLQRLGLTVTAKIELLLNIVWCFVVYSVQLPVCWIFCLPWLFQSFCLSQFIPVINFQYWSCKSWVSVLVLDIKVLVLVLVLELLSFGLGLGLGTAESWSWTWSWICWSWSWISKSWIQVCRSTFAMKKKSLLQLETMATRIEVTIKSGLFDPCRI